MADVPALQAYLQKEFGGRFEAKADTVSIGTSATKAVDHNFERMGLTFINLGANTLYIAPDRSVDSTHGIFLAANGGSLSLNVRDDLTLVGHEWYALADTSADDLYVLQVVRYNPGS